MELNKANELLTRKIFNDLDKRLIKDEHKTEILKILQFFNSKSIKNRLKNIYDFIKYDVSGDWLERLDIIQRVLKNDVMSDYALEIRYGKCNVENKKNELKNKVSHTLEIYKNKHGEVEGKIKYENYKIKSKTPWGLEACVKKFGEVEGLKKWEERLNKKNTTMLERKKIKPYKNGRTLFEYQERYGVEDGYKRWLLRNKKQSYRFSKEYYIKQFGVEEGEKLWITYKNNMDKTSLTSFIKRYGEKIGSIKYYEYIDKLFKCGLFYSKISQELFWGINQYLFDDNLVKFYEKNGEEIFYINKFGLKCIFVDFKYKNKIIEFDGDYWHNKPEQIIQDKLRDEYLTSVGYEILRVKESEYIKNKEEMVNKCIIFLNK